MMNERQRYLRKEKFEQDRSQLCFGSDGQYKFRKIVRIQRGALNVMRMVSCPFCLKSAKVQKFLVSGKKGISKHRAVCPFCELGMLLRTLLKKWNVNSYAEWVYAYSKSGFWKKIDYKEWKFGLKLKEWDQAFWLRYKALKGSAESGVDDSDFDADKASRMYDEIEASKGGWK